MQQLEREQRKERGSQVGRSGKVPGSETNEITKGKETKKRRRKKKKKEEKDRRKRRRRRGLTCW